MAYVNGAPEPFPNPAIDGAYTPGIFAIIEWEDGDVTFAVYPETLAASGAVTPLLVSDLFFPAVETLTVAASAAPSIPDEVYAPAFSHVVLDVGEEGGALTFSHTVTGTDPALVVTVITTNASGNSIDAITYNGVALTKQHREVNSGRDWAAEVWTLKAPATGAHNVVITRTGSGAVIAGADSFTNTNQDDPVVGSGGANGTSATPGSGLVNTAPGGVLVDCTAASDVLAVVAPGVQIWNDGGGEGTQYVATDGSPAQSVWSSGGTPDYVIAAVALRPPGGLYADDLKVNLSVTGALTTETWISLEVVTVVALAPGGGLASELVDSVETLTVPAAITPRLAAETYVATNAETIKVNASTTLSLTTDLVERDILSVVPDLEATVRCYTLGVDVNLFSVYASVKAFAVSRVVKL